MLIIKNLVIVEIYLNLYYNNRMDEKMPRPVFTPKGVQE
jgi:hypothetical protein